MWIVANTAQQRNFSLELFSNFQSKEILVKKNTEKFSDGSLMFVYIGLNSFKINFNPTHRCSFAPPTWKGLCPLSWQEYWGRFHDFSATKPPCFLLCTWHLESRDPPGLHWQHCLNDLFVTVFWTIPYSFCQKHRRVWVFQFWYLPSLS